PSGAYTMDQTPSACAVQWRTSLRPVKSQMRIFSSSPPDANVFPSGETATEWTPLCSSSTSVPLWLPVSASQMMMVPSLLPQQRDFPWGKKASVLTKLAFILNSRIASPDVASHRTTLKFPYPPPEAAIWFPSGEKTKDVTVPPESGKQRISFP